MPRPIGTSAISIRRRYFSVWPGVSGHDRHLLFLHLRRGKSLGPGGRRRAIAAAVVMIVLGFFFAAVSGNLVGLIGSSNNPVSGLTLCTLVVAALLLVSLGVAGVGGVAAVLGVAAVVCVSSAVAGEMLQDLKVGHILGGTPSKMQFGDILGCWLPRRRCSSC